MKEDRRNYANVLFFAIMICFICTTFFHIFFIRDAIHSTKKIEMQTITFVKDKLKMYENFQANDRTKSLVRLMDKTTGLANNLKNEPDYNQELLDLYAKEQNISGILVLDGSGKIAMQTTGNSVDWTDFLEGENVKEIYECKQKVYMLRMENGGAIYDIAVVARRDDSGIVMSYILQDTVTEGVNDITIDTIFDKIFIEYDGMIVITSGDKVVASNEKENYQTKADEWEQLTQNMQSFGNGIGRVLYHNRIWYMGVTKYQTYTIYLLFPFVQVYKTYIFVMIGFVLVYFMIVLSVWEIHSNAEKKHYRQLRKQYRIIDAISSTYTSTLLVNIYTGKLEWIKVPKYVKEIISEIDDVNTMFKVLADTCVKEEYREEFLKFTDINSVKDRLLDKTIISMTYEDMKEEWLTIGIIPQQINVDGDIEVALYLVRNVTEEQVKEKEYQKQLQYAVEQAKRADIAKTSFLRHMSHDIRTPINGIAGLVDMADSYGDDVEKLRENRESVKGTIEYLLSLVNNVLDISKLESGGITLENEAFDLVQLLEEECSIIKIQAADLNLMYIEEANDIKHRYLIGSAHHLRRILMNLAGNSMKYNRSNGSLSVYCKELEAEKDTVTYQFICEDTGIGMSEEFLKRAFEPFAQEGKESYTSYTGSGLGLPLVKEMVDLMQGSIEIMSKENEGTRCIVTLPFTVNKNPVVEERKQELRIDITGRRALLVDDHRMNLKIAQAILEGEGLIVTTAINGKEAVELFEQTKPYELDFIFMDIMMPVLDGLSATKQIRNANRPDAKTIPILAMSANAFEDDITASLEAGMNGYITKPLNIDKIRQEIQNVLKENQNRKGSQI